MDQTDYPVEAPPPPPRKVRSKPLTMREQGIDVLCCNGQFVMPREQGQTTPLVTGLRRLSLTIYNQTAVWKLVKAHLEAALENADAEACPLLQPKLSFVNKKIGALRTVGKKLRYYILHVEGCKPLNEPQEWGKN